MCSLFKRIIQIGYFILVIWISELEGTDNNGSHWCKNNSGIRVTTSDRLRRLRNRISFYDYGAYIITTSDEHQSEYLSEHDKRRKYISGFSGTAATIVVFREEGAALWTDGRYFGQAMDELDCNWTLMKSGIPGTPTITQHIIQMMSSSNSKRLKWIGVDPKLLRHQDWLDWSKEFSKADLLLVASDSNLVDEIWTTATGRPSESNTKVAIHNIKYAGKSWEDKVNQVRKELIKNKTDSLVITELVEIAWLLNLRGDDVPYVPVFKAFVFLTDRNIWLFINANRLSSAVEQHLNIKKCKKETKCVQVEVKPYSSIYNELKRQVKNASLKTVISKTASYAIYQSIPEEQLVVDQTPTHKLMIIKNEIEAEGLRKSMLRDSIVLIDFLAMMEESVDSGGVWDEITAAQALDKRRSKQTDNRGPSFETISAFGKNSALPHYSPKSATNKVINKSSMYLLDSGGQYLDGTTDITRTMHFGQPTPFQIESYTRVLQGSIALASLIFPNGTKDTEVDILTRQYLYNYGLDYSHGTGHGVGSYLSVHEYPPLIGFGTKGYSFTPGMFFSIEPGFYKLDDFGIRLETIFNVVEANTENNFNNVKYFKFRPVVFVPFETKLINKQLLNRDHIKWLNDYNAKTLNLVGVELRRQGNERAYNWLLKRCIHIAINDCKNSTDVLVPFYNLFVLIVVILLNYLR